MEALALHPTASTGVTRRLLGHTLNIRYEQIPSDVVSLVKQCWLDWIGVAIAGGREPLTTILVNSALDCGSVGGQTLTGRRERLSLHDAVLVNGAASHALDYDDGNHQMMGHTSVAIAPAVFSLGERLRCDGKTMIEAFLAGYETSARIGILVDAPQHYERGFHATSTIGSFGAAAGAAKLMGLDVETSATALGIAGTQTGGLQAVFGSMSKPLNAGRASLNGLLGALLARRGFTAPRDILGCRQGFSDAFATGFAPDKALAPPQQGFHIFDGRFKFHAACQITHATIEAVTALRNKYRLDPDQIARLVLIVPTFADRVCNIQEPRSGLEVKFSLRGVAALALRGFSTADPSAYTEEFALDPGTVALRDKIVVELTSELPRGVSCVTAELHDGRKVSGTYDESKHGLTVAEQGQRVAEKFRSLVGPIIGTERADAIERLVSSLEGVPDFSEVAKLSALPEN